MYFRLIINISTTDPFFQNGILSIPVSLFCVTFGRLSEAQTLTVKCLVNKKGFINFTTTACRCSIFAVKGQEHLKLKIRTIKTYNRLYTASNKYIPKSNANADIEKTE